MPKQLSKAAKIDAYNQAISYLNGEECAYDNEGDYKAARLWLAKKLDTQCTKWLQTLRPKHAPHSKTHKTN